MRVGALGSITGQRGGFHPALWRKIKDDLKEQEKEIIKKKSMDVNKATLGSKWR